MSSWHGPEHGASRDPVPGTRRATSSNIFPELRTLGLRPLRAAVSVVPSGDAPSTNSIQYTLAKKLHSTVELCFDFDLVFQVQRKIIDIEVLATDYEQPQPSEDMAMHDISDEQRRETPGFINFIWLEITEKCNLQCSHCYADSGPSGSLEGTMSYEDWIDVIDEAAALGCTGVQFIGGEPTLHPHFKDLISHARSQKFALIEVFTNATRLDKKLVKFLAESGVQVATSFYSEQAATHEKITRGKGSWNRTVQGISNTLAAKIPLRVGIIQTPSNQTDIEDTISFLQGLGVAQVGKDRQRKIGRGGTAADRKSETEDYGELCGQCAKQRLCVTSKGDVFPCVFSRKTLLGSAKDGLENLAKGAKLAHFKSQMNSIGEQKQAYDPCYPNADCGPKTCLPQVQCNPNTFCSPDRSCQPQYVGADFENFLAADGKN
jgi:sulfatase maturation enzyme AslB (radical SAM superfamily)